jgi:hypothetical protein
MNISSDAVAVPVNDRRRLQRVRTEFVDRLHCRIISLLFGQGLCSGRLFKPRGCQPGCSKTALWRVKF